MQVGLTHFGRKSDLIGRSSRRTPAGERGEPSPVSGELQPPSLSWRTFKLSPELSTVKKHDAATDRRLALGPTAGERKKGLVSLRRRTQRLGCSESQIRHLGYNDLAPVCLDAPNVIEFINYLTYIFLSQQG